MFEHLSMAHPRPANAATNDHQASAFATTVYRADWIHLAVTLPPHSIDFLYTDPPFNTGLAQTDRAGSFADRWPTTDLYVAWLEDRLRATVPALKPSAVVILHLDWRTSHHARLLLDRLLGPDRFVNHLVWSYGLGGSSNRRFARKHDDLLVYCLNPDLYYFNPPLVPATSARLKGKLKKSTDVLDIPSLNNMARERTGYPTQKPLELLTLLVNAFCPPDGTVLDPCCGSGTTLVAAATLGRGFIGGDVSADAVQLTKTRLHAVERIRAPPRPSAIVDTSIETKQPTTTRTEKSRS